MKALLAAGLLGLAGTSVLAQDFPSGPIRIVVPYAAGGPSDTGTRLVQEP
jgi:tripartite-type tricarboxylate transporter receptor subunit TctC